MFQQYSIYLYACILFCLNGTPKTNGLLEEVDIPSIGDLVNMVNQMNSTLQKSTQDISKLETDLNVKDQEIAKLKAEISTMKNRYGNSPVAFYAKLDNAVDPLGVHQTVVYDHVITNLGNGYDTRHGHFVAPVKGVYQFSVSFMGSINAWEYLDIVKNGIVVGSVYSDGQHLFETGAGSVVVTLNTGDMVWVRYGGGAASHVHGRFNLFSGFLIQHTV